jgi:chorismate mutase
MHIRGIRGAITVETNTVGAILDATRELLEELVRANQIEPDELAAVFFTATLDLNAAYPAEAARRMGWTAVPLLSFADIDVPGTLPRCIRVLMLWNTPRTQEEIVHIYLRDAGALRPDLKGPRTGFAAGDAS